MAKTQKTKSRQISKDTYSNLTLVQRVDYLAELIFEIREKLEDTRQAVKNWKRKSRVKVSSSPQQNSVPRKSR
jgi:hypothetical protein